LETVKFRKWRRMHLKLYMKGLVYKNEKERQKTRMGNKKNKAF
jgi:hypothetical protein